MRYDYTPATFELITIRRHTIQNTHRPTLAIFYDSLNTIHLKFDLVLGKCKMSLSDVLIINLRMEEFYHFQAKNRRHNVWQNMIGPYFLSQGAKYS